MGWRRHWTAAKVLKPEDLSVEPGPAPARAIKYADARIAYELAFSTVTARRFCDQHEMSLQTATGRSLP